MFNGHMLPKNIWLFHSRECRWTAPHNYHFQACPLSIRKSRSHTQCKTLKPVNIMSISVPDGQYCLEIHSAFIVRTTQNLYIFCLAKCWISYHRSRWYVYLPVSIRR
jgi:hypothetical protein